MDTRDVVARFGAERQALALMDHPNISRVLDAGSTPFGRPYFVMELVRGVPITDYCDAQRLAPKDRLDLFVTVCQAVQHAHQKGVIHRDIKPFNVLVTMIDGKPVPKVIDFGVAKAVGQSLTEKTIYTRFAQILGTPLYMSPEQAEMSGVDVDTRSRRLRARRPPLRAPDRHDPVRPRSVPPGGVRRDPADHPRGRAASPEHPSELPGARPWPMSPPTAGPTRASSPGWSAASSTGSS